MRTRILIACAALAVLTLSFSSCKKDDKKVDNVKLAVTQEKDGVKIMVGMTATLEIKTQPAKAEYTCVSEDPAVATVDNKGVITGVKVGKTAVAVTAGSTTKKVAVEVIPFVEVKDDMYIGLHKDGSEQYIPAIYMPYKEDNLTKDKQEEIVYAMTSKGWKFTHYEDDADSKTAFLFQAPKERKDWQMRSFAYYHTPSAGQRFCLGIQSAWKGIDPLAPEDQLDENAKKIRAVVLDVAKLYGFTEKMAFGPLKGGENAMSAYNLSRGEDKPLDLLAYSKKQEDPTDGTIYVVIFQITWNAPKKQQSLASRAVCSQLEDNVDLSMLLQHSK